MILALCAALAALTLFSAESPFEECVLQAKHAHWYISNNAQKTSREVGPGLHIFCTQKPHTLKGGTRTTLVSAFYNNGRDPVQEVYITASLLKNAKTSKLMLCVEQDKQEIPLWEKTAQNFKEDLGNLELVVSPEDGRECVLCSLHNNPTTGLAYFLEVACMTYPSVQASVLTNTFVYKKNLRFFQNEEREEARAPSTSSPHIYRGQTFSLVRLPEHLALNPVENPTAALLSFLQSLNISSRTVVAHAPQPMRIGKYGAISTCALPDTGRHYIFYTREKNGGQCEIISCKAQTPPSIVSIPQALTPLDHHHIVFVLDGDLRGDLTARLHFKEDDLMLKQVFTKSGLNATIASACSNS